MRNYRYMFSNSLIFGAFLAFMFAVVWLWNLTPVAAVAFVAAVIGAGVVYERRWQARHGRR